MIAKLIAVPSRLWLWMSASAARSVQNVASAFSQIWANRSRSLLTTLGVIIAVTAIITVVAFVQGFGKYMTNMLRGYGTQYMIVRPVETRSGPFFRTTRVTLTLDDIRAVQSESAHIKRLSPFVFTETDVSYGRENVQAVPMRGVTEDYQTIRNYYCDAGRFFGPIDIENSENVCVMGRSLLKLLQVDESILGDYIQIHDARFRVIGLLEPKGSFMGDDQDLTLMIPYTTALNLFTTEQREVLRFLAEARNEESIPDAEAEIRRVLRRRHDLAPGTPDDFEVQRQDQMLKEFERVRLAVTALLGGIVSISLVVGGIGIMNVMFVSVTERTREIGLRKSVGGRRRDIMLQFLTEAVVLSTLGGAIGILLGFGITGLASLHPKMVPIEVPFWSVALALGFSVGAGILFGIIPAFKAAILHPIDALRHE